MYYKGDVISLWNFLSDIFYQYDEEDLYSSSALSSITNLAHLVLRDVECGILINSLVQSEAVKSSFKILRYLEILSRIIDTPSIDPKLKARALAIRVIEQCDWRRGEVLDLDGYPASEEIKRRSLREAQEAIEIAKQYSLSDKALLENALYIVHTGLGLPLDDCWKRVCIEAKSIKHGDDLYFAIHFSRNKLHRALNNRDVMNVKSALAVLSENQVSGGECGQLMADHMKRELTQSLESPVLSSEVKASLMTWLNEKTDILHVHPN